MAADLDHGYHRWSPNQLTDPESLQETSITQMLDQGSISFGRFAVDSLSWEKRSVFNHNRHLEELEKFKAPGLVAQKKAYFEAYYKRIRALKGMEVDKQQTDISLDSSGNGSVSSQATEDDNTIMPIIREDITGTCFSQSYPERDQETVNSNGVDHVRYFSSETSESFLYPTNGSFDEFDRNVNTMSSDLDANVNMPSCTQQSIENSKDFALENGLGNTIQAVHSLDLSENMSKQNIEPNSDGASLMHLQANDSIFTSSRNVNVTDDMKDCKLSTNIEMNPRKSQCNGGSFEHTQSDQIAAVIAVPSKRNGLASFPDDLDQVGTTVGINIAKRSKSLIKEIDSLRRIGTKPGRQTKPDSARLFNESKQKMVENKKIISNTVKGMSDGLPVYSVAISEKRSRVTIPCPFSFATDKRAMTENKPTTSGLTEVVHKNFKYKITDKLASSACVKAATSVENNVRKTAAAHSAERRVLERNRRQEFQLTKISRADSHLTNGIRKDAHLDRKNNRSINLPTSDKLRLHGGSNSGMVNDSKAKKSQGETVKRITRQKGISESAISKVARTYMGEVKKDLQVAASKTIDMIAKRKTPRQEVRRWR